MTDAADALHREGEAEFRPRPAAKPNGAPRPTLERMGEDCPPSVQFTPTPFKHRDLASFPRRQWLYGRHYIRGFLSATVAPSGVGKSSLSIAEAIAMTAGQNLLGVQSAKLRVWYWNGEDPPEEIDRRIEAACRHFGIDPSSIQDRLFRDSGRETEIIVASQTKAGAVISSPIQAALIDALRSGEFDVLIVDPFVAAHRVSENDNEGHVVQARVNPARKRERRPCRRSRLRWRRNAVDVARRSRWCDRRRSSGRSSPHRCRPLP